MQAPKVASTSWIHQVLSDPGYQADIAKLNLTLMPPKAAKLKIHQKFPLEVFDFLREV